PYLCLFSISGYFRLSCHQGGANAIRGAQRALVLTPRGPGCPVVCKRAQLRSECSADPSTA
ncbi:MAG: hypothetical protein ACRD7E_06040, partial [Bryobacteraceae bacterium]